MNKSAARTGPRSGGVVLRYWGSHFKSERHAQLLGLEFEPVLRRGWVIHLVMEHPPSDPSWLEGLCKMGVCIVYQPRPRGQLDFRCIRNVLCLCRETGARVFHCDNMHTSPLIGAFLAGVPVRIWSKRSMNADFEECRPPTLKERIGLSTRLSCLLATKVFAISSAVKEQLVGMGVPERRILVRNNPRILNPVVSPSNPEAARKSWGCSTSDVVIATVGHAVPVKAWDVLLHAFATVAGKIPNCRLVLIGSYSGPGEKEFYRSLQKIVEENHLAGKVIFTGYMAPIQADLPAADIFVLPSRSEGCARALVEALEAGLPIVATRVGNAAEVLRDGINGFLVERCDVAGLANALAKLAGNTVLRAEFRKQAKLPPTVLTVPQFGEQIAGDYERLLARSNLPV